MKKYVFKPYSPIFPLLFEKEKKRIALTLKTALAIEHVGSTAVPGLGGKGIIDIAIAVDQKDIQASIALLQSIGYEFRPNFSTPDRAYFIIYLPDPEEGTRRYHIHLTYLKSNDWKNLIEFRDYLRTHPEELREYAQLKQKAALEADQNGTTYRKLKEPMFQKIKRKKVDMHQTLSERKPSLFILLLLVSFASIAAVLFTPALPEIAQKLSLTAGQAQLTLSLFLVGYAIGNLPYGPLSNRFGRKSAAYLGILLAAIGSLLVVTAGRFGLFWLLLVGRFLMALGSSVGIKIAFTLIGDCYQGEQATKKISYLMLAFAIGPGLAIALGGFLTDRFGWESCFYFLTGYSLFIFFATFFLPETASHLDPHALNLNKISSGYLAKLKNKKLVLSALLMGCGTSFVYLFASEAPFIGIDRIGLSPNTYGLLNFIPPVGMVAGTFLSHFLADKKPPLTVIFLGIAISFLASALMLLLFAFGQITPFTLFLPMPFIYLGLSLVFSNASALAMSHAQNKSNASAMMNFLNMGLCVLFLFAFEILPSTIPFAMPLVFILMTVVMLFLHRTLSKASN